MRPLALLLLAPLASAQGAVHVVGSGGAFSDLQTAIDAAADGDVVLVKSGAYGPFTLLGKGVTIVADNEAEVVADGPWIVRDVPAGSLAVIRGLVTGARSGHGLRVESCAGAVRVEECVLVGQNSPAEYQEELVFHGAQILDSDAVLLARSTLRGGNGGQVGFFSEPTGGGSGVLAFRARVAVAECALYGGFGADGPFDDWYSGGAGGSGVIAYDADLWISGVTATGGHGGDGYSDFDPLFGTLLCGDGGDGGDGVRVLAFQPSLGFASSAVVVRDLTATPGVGGQTECADLGEDGQALDLDEPEMHALTTLSGAASGAWASSPARTGTNARLYVRGEPGDVAIVGIGEPVPYLALPGHPLPIATLPKATLVLGAVPPSGVAMQAIPVPALPAGTLGLTLGVQGVIVPAGGAGFELAPFGTITLLDPAL